MRHPKYTSLSESFIRTKVVYIKVSSDINRHEKDTNMLICFDIKSIIIRIASIR
jgi:hypothetical protein